VLVEVVSAEPASYSSSPFLVGLFSGFRDGRFSEPVSKVGSDTRAESGNISFVQAGPREPSDPYLF
jgi:hypothetical protein